MKKLQSGYIRLAEWESSFSIFTAGKKFRRKVSFFGQQNFEIFLFNFFSKKFFEINKSSFYSLGIVKL
jgi:hypothetical protein